MATTYKDFSAKKGIVAEGGDVTIKSGNSLVLQNTSAATITITAPNAIDSNYELKLPANDGNANDFLKSDGSGNLSWASLGDIGGGTVTSVAMTVPTGLTVSGSPITSSGTLAVTLTSGYTIPTTTAIASISDKIELTDLSITTASAGTAALEYNSSTGAFTFTPPDLSSYLTSVAFGDLTSTPTTLAGYGITDAYTETEVDTLLTNSTNWDTAYSWGDHSTAGYLTSYTETSDLDDVTGRGATTTNAITVGELNATNGDFSGNLVVDGDLTVGGTTTTVNATQLEIEDNLIHIAGGNTGDTTDFGWIGHYNDGTDDQHAGVFRDATDGKFYFFGEYSADEMQGLTVNRADASFALATVVADAFEGDGSGLTGLDYNNISNAPSLFDGAYSSLTGAPTTVSSFTNDAGYLTSYTETQTLADVTALGSSTTTSISSRGLVSTDSSDNKKFEVTATAVKMYDAYTFPSADGSAGYYLKTNGSGTLSWSAVATTLDEVTDGGANTTNNISVSGLRINNGTNAYTQLGAIDVAQGDTLSGPVTVSMASSVRGVEFTAVYQELDTSTQRHIVKGLVTHDGTDGYVTEYGSVYTSVDCLPTLDVSFPEAMILSFDSDAAGNYAITIYYTILY